MSDDLTLEQFDRDCKLAEWAGIGVTLKANELRWLLEANKLLRETLEAVQPFYFITGDDGIPKKYCWWCHVVAGVSGEYAHASDCLYQRAMSKGGKP
jgi:hypothetical protein